MTKLLRALCLVPLLTLVALVALKDTQIGGWRWTWAWPNRWRLDSGQISIDNTKGERISAGKFYRCGPVFIEYREFAGL